MEDHHGRRKCSGFTGMNGYEVEESVVQAEVLDEHVVDDEHALM